MSVVGFLTHNGSGMFCRPKLGYIGMLDTRLISCLQHMDSTSLANSLPASAFPLILNTTKPHKNSSMATRTCPSPTSTKLPSSLIRSFYHENGVGRILVPCANHLYGPVLTLQMYH